jgi:hypothetical protein
MSRYENHIETDLGSENGLFKVYLDSRHLYMFLKTNEFQIIGYIKSEERFKEVPHNVQFSSN